MLEGGLRDAFEPAREGDHERTVGDGRVGEYAEYGAASGGGMLGAFSMIGDRERELEEGSRW